MLSRSFFILLALFFTFLTHAQSQKYNFQRPKMGSPFSITVYSDDSVKVYETVEKAYRYVDTLNQIFSDYSETSEINQLCKNERVGEWQTVSPVLFAVLKTSFKAAKESNGAFDITVGNIVKLWRKARKEKRLPNEQLLKATLSKTGYKKVKIDEKMLKIRFYTEGVLLDFGGIVKGFAAQEVVRILTEAGFPACLVDAGGDLVAGEKAGLNAPTWSIGISVPQSDNRLLPQFLNLKNQAVATSGDMYNYLEVGGKRYSHIVNPKTGMGLTHQRNVTIIAPDGAMADWLATACSVLPLKKALKLAQKYPNTEILILENNNGKIKMWQSAGFSKYFSSN